MNDRAAGGHGQRPQTKPGSVSLEDGQVMLDGPDGVAVAMTPEAALETGRRLIDVAERAGARRPG
ncbi:hypothetical protein FHT00_000790 [Sphingomonas insulae]|nr:hypothetical protein [Sphingomonas insulae]NIJ28857.1 hypothetical protein [Sphingomonas insulae]